MKINSILPGQVFFQRAKKHGLIGLTAFVRIKDRANELTCSDCGANIWNVNNFGADVHFCVDREFDLILTDWTAKKN